MGVGDLLHRRQHRARRHHVVAEQHEEGLRARGEGGAAHGVAEPQRLGLVAQAHGQRPRLGHGVGAGALAAAAQQALARRVAREVGRDLGLGGARDDQALVDAGGPERLLDHVLDDRPVEHRQHLLGRYLRGRQEAGAEAGGGDDGLHVRPFLTYS